MRILFRHAPKAQILAFIKHLAPVDVPPFLPTKHPSQPQCASVTDITGCLRSRSYDKRNSSFSPHIDMNATGYVTTHSMILYMAFKDSTPHVHRLNPKAEREDCGTTCKDPRAIRFHAVSSVCLCISLLPPYVVSLVKRLDTYPCNGHAGALEGLDSNVCTGQFCYAGHEDPTTDEGCLPGFCGTDFDTDDACRYR